MFKKSGNFSGQNGNGHTRQGATVSPGQFPIGSVESRAAARLLLEKMEPEWPAFRELTPEETDGFVIACLPLGVLKVYWRETGELPIVQVGQRVIAEMQEHFAQKPGRIKHKPGRSWVYETAAAIAGSAGILKFTDMAERARNHDLIESARDAWMRQGVTLPFPFEVDGDDVLILDQEQASNSDQVRARDKFGSWFVCDLLGKSGVNCDWYNFELAAGLPCIFPFDHESYKPRALVLRVDLEAESMTVVSGG